MKEIAVKQQTMIYFIIKH